MERFPLDCTQELFLPSRRARLPLNEFLSNVSEKHGGGGAVGRETFVYIFKNCLAGPFATCQYQQALCLNVYALSWRRQYVTMSTFLILEVESFFFFLWYVMICYVVKSL